MWEPKLRTPGTARSSLLTPIVVRSSSPSDVPGLEIQCIRKSRSLNSGNNSEPMNGSTRHAAMISTSAPENARFGLDTMLESARS